MRALGLDLGSQRIGVALSDSDATLALPYDVVVRTGDRDRDHRRIADIVAETGAEVVVVGLPLSLDGERARWPAGTGPRPVGSAPPSAFPWRPTMSG